MCLAKRNARYNETIPLPVGLINGQSLGAVSGVKFGVGRLGWNGCEVLAVYNALQLLGVPCSLLQVVSIMERHTMLAGLLGVNPYALGRVLHQFSVETVRLSESTPLLAALCAGSDCLYVYWTGTRFFSTIHTVCLHPEGETLTVYNAYSNWEAALACPASEFIGSRKMIVGYRLVPIQ